MPLGKRLITHVIPPAKYPPAGEFEALNYYTRLSHDAGKYYLGSSSNHFPKHQIDGLILEGVIVNIEQEIPLEENWALLCNSKGEVIYASRNDGADGADPIFVLKLTPTRS